MAQTTTNQAIPGKVYRHVSTGMSVYSARSKVIGQLKFGELMTQDLPHCYSSEPHISLLYARLLSDITPTDRLIDLRSDSLKKNIRHHF